MKKIIVFLLLSIWGPMSVMAASVVLDQTSLITDTGANDVTDRLTSYQSFVVGVEGLLSQISLAVYKYEGSELSHDLTLTLYSAIPSPANEIASFSLAPADIPGVSYGGLGYPELASPLPPTNIDVSSAGVNVSIGQEYYMKLSTSQPYDKPPSWEGPWLDRYLWADSEPYAPGVNLQCNNVSGDCITYSDDQVFATYVSPVPIPAAACLFGSALAGLACLPRRQLT